MCRFIGMPLQRTMIYPIVKFGDPVLETPGKPVIEFDDKLKQLLDQRAAQQLRLDGLVDDYATGLLDRAELSRAKTKAQAELSRINGEIELLGTRKRWTFQLAFRESLRQVWEANESIGWRGALIDKVVERIEVFPGIGKPFVNVDGITMRFDKDRVVITWRRVDSDAASAA